MGSLRSPSRGSNGSSFRSTRVGGTPSYMSPEMFSGSFSEKSDLWSLGVIVFQLLSGELPYKAENFMMQANLVCNPRRHPPWDLLTKFSWSLGARWFCQQLLSQDEFVRPTAALALQDTWIVRAVETHAVVKPKESERQALQQQHLQSHLMKMAVAAVTSQLSLSQLHHLNLRFKHYDKSNDGRLCHAEMREVLRDVGVPSAEDVELIIESLDSDHSGLIEYSEFIAGCIDLANDNVKEHLRAAFDIFDLDGSGNISLQELRQVLTVGPGVIPPAAGQPQAGLGSVLPDGKTVEVVMKELDRDGTGKVSFDEFQSHLLNEHLWAGRELHAKSRAKTPVGKEEPCPPAEARTGQPRPQPAGGLAAEEAPASARTTADGSAPASARTAAGSSAATQAGTSHATTPR